ncbi:MAG: helix-turn-helix domain-containing protein [Rhizobiaceae bacterium]
MTRRVNLRKIKSGLPYTCEEAAEALNVTVQTVRSWEKRGLQIMKSQRPYLICGAVLREFLEKKQESRKQRLADNELYCTKCKKPRNPYGDMADYIPLNDKSGRLVGLCSFCEKYCQRFVSLGQLPKLQAHIEIVIRDGS